MDETNLDFWKLFERIASLDHLSAKETRYLLFRFYNNKTDREIAELENKDITRQAVNIVIQRAYRKIREARKK